MIIYDKDGAVLLDIEVDDTSVRYKALKGENSLTLKFSLAEHVEVPLGSYCLFKNERYTLMLPEDLTMNHRRSFEYSLVMYSEDAKAKRYKFINPVDGRLKFSLTAKPKEHLQMFVDNMNMRDYGWKVGRCPEQVEMLLSYNHTFCHDALVQLADQLELDYWFEYRLDEKYVHIGKLELNKENPLLLTYGGDGEGLKPNIKRTNYTDALPLEVLYVQGSDVNINPSKYGANELHLPKSQTIGFDGEYFEDEESFNDEEVRYYKTDSNGYSVARADRAIANHSEDSVDCTCIEPTKEEKVLSVIEVNAEDHFYDVVFESNVDYKNYVIEGEKATVVFQSGMLAGKEFDLATDTDGNLICKNVDGRWRVEIVPQTIDGITMPEKSSGYVPVNGDTFKVFGIQLPDEYISDDTNKSGAEWDMFRYAVKHFYNNEDAQYTVSGELDEIYAKKDWVNIASRLTLGSYVMFRDKSFQPEPILIRITGIKEYVNKPYSPFLEISNAPVSGTLVGSLNRIENQEAYTEKIVSDSRKFTKRSFADAQRAIKLLEDAFGEGFEQSIKPATIQTMMMLVGDESLQFSFVKAIGSDDTDSHNAYFDLETKTFKCDAGIIKHYTLDVNEIRSSFDQHYHYWTMPEFESAVLDDASKDYYVYAVVNSEADSDNDFRLEDLPIGIKDRLDSEKRYYLLLGLLLAEYEGSRDFMPLYGFTQILPGQITTDVIRSADGKTYFDLARNEIGGVIKFKAGSYGELNIGTQNLLRNSGFTGDYLSEPLADQSVMDAAKELFSDPKDHWELDRGCSIIELADISESGYGVEFDGNINELRQNLHYNVIKGEAYVVTFKGKSTAADSEATVFVGGASETICVADEWEKCTVRLVPTMTSNGFFISSANLQICEIQLERGTIATAWSQSYLDNISDRAYYQSLKYVEHALNEGSTTIGGGLVLTNHIKVGNYANKEMIEETGGMQGTWTSNDDPFLWGGGSLDKAIETVKKYKDNPSYQPTEDEMKEMANFVVTHGGRAILNDMVLRGYVNALGGRIGKLRIEDGGIAADIEGGDGLGSMKFHPSGFMASTMGGSASIGASVSAAMQAYSKDAMLSSPSNINAAIVAEGTDEQYAIYSRHGMYAGLRPNIRSIESDANLNEVDHTLIVKNSQEITISLPYYPEKGQTYKLIHTTSNNVVFSHSNNQSVIDPRTQNNTINGFSERTTVTLTYLEGVWYAEFNN